MRRVPVVLAVISAFLFFIAAPSIADDNEKGINLGQHKHPSWLSLRQQTASHGSYAIAFDYSIGAPSPRGDFIDCTGQPSEVVLQVRGTFDFYAGICDDFAGPSCDNRLIYVNESCEGVTDGEQVYRIRADFSRSEVFICFDEDFDGICSDFEVVATGVKTAQSQGFVVEGVIQAPARQYGVRTILKSKPFRFNGSWVRIPRTGTHVNVLFDMPEFVPEGCDAVFTPCGFAESGVGIGR
jgi:hypothetical protein